MCTNLNYRVLGTNTAVIFLSNDHYLYEHRMNVMLDFICIGLVDMQGTRWKRKKNTK